MRLLLLEDDSLFADSLRDLLRPQFTVDVAASIHDAEHFTSITEYDFMLFDLQLPDGKGSDLCAHLRALQVTTPIVVMTGFPECAPQARTLNLGADDYLEKPFKSRDLLARINAILRRTQPAKDRPTTEDLHCGDLNIHIPSQSVFRRGQSISLRRKEYQLLEFFVRHQGHVITRETLLEHVWESDDMSFNTVDAHIKALRAKIDKPFAHPLIHTVHGYGYKMSTQPNTTIPPSQKRSSLQFDTQTTQNLPTIFAL